MIRLIGCALVTTLAIDTLTAQPAAGPSLKDYVGTYTESPGQTLEIVAGTALYAVIAEAKYLLRPAGTDAFLNGGGDTVRFTRNAVGVVAGYLERGVLHPRLSPNVTAASAALADPGPAGKIAAADYRYRAPRNRGDGIAVGHARDSDLDTATAAAIVRSVLDGTYKDVHGILIFQRGKLVLEEYFYGYSFARMHQMRSATKSVVSAMAGIAIDRRAIPSADVPVAPLLPYAAFDNPDPRKAKVTLASLLSMSSGLDCNDYSATSPGRETVLYESPDWVKATLDLPMAANPGSVARYCSGGVAVVGRTVEHSVKMSMPDFAQANLFSPLGIARSNWKWNYTLTNANREYSQIHLRPRDMLKFGLLFANGGMWNGTRVISEAWVKASLAEQSQIDGTGYGYFWWRPWLNVQLPGGAQRVNMIAAQGNGGQKIYIVPELDLVAVFTGGDYNSGGSPPNRIMARIILPKLLEARARRGERTPAGT